MDDQSLFRQKGPGQVPIGQDQEALDSNPSEQSGANVRIGTPVWRSFVQNKAFQEANKETIRAEQNQIRSAEINNRRLDRQQPQAEIWKGGNGKLLRKIGRQTEELSAEDYVDHPVAGAEARKSLWDREIRTAKKESDDAAFTLKNPAFHAKSLSDKDRETKLAEGKMLQESDPRHQQLKAELAADDDYRKTKAELAQKSYDSEARARQLESTDPDSWWQSRKPPTAGEQRAAVVADTQARRAEAQAADQSAEQELTEIDAKLKAGVRGSEVQELQARRAEVAASRGLIAQEAAKTEQGIEQVKADASKQLSAPDESGYRDIVATYIGTGTTAQKMSGNEPGKYEKAKGSLNEIGDANASVAAALKESGGDIDQAIQQLAQKSARDNADLAASQRYMGMNPAAFVIPEKRAAANQGGFKLLNDLKAELDAAGVDPNDRPRIIQDAAKANAWTEKDSDNIRKLSTGEIVINPGRVFGQRDSLVSEIKASASTDAEKQAAIQKLDAMRAAMADGLANDLHFGDARMFGIGEFRDFVEEKTEKGEADDTAALLDEWTAKQKDRNAVFKFNDAIWSGIAKGEIGIAKTVVGTGAGIAGGLELEAAKPLADAQALLGATIESASKAEEQRGQTGAYGITSDLTSTVTQMLPMFVGGSAAQGLKGISQTVTAGMATSGWAAAQGYESKLYDAAEMAREKKGSALTGEEIAAVYADGKTQMAAFLNAAQTAALTKMLPGGSERAALGTTAKSMTARDFIAGGGAKALRDQTLRAELKAMGKTIFADATDETIEEGLNQALDLIISKAVLGKDVKLGDAIEEIAQSGALGGFVGGALPQIRRGERAAATGQPPLAPQPAGPETISTALAAVDPEAEPASPEEIAVATRLSTSSDPSEIAEIVLIERELAQVEADDEASVDAADQAVVDATSTGDKIAIKSAETARESVKGGRADTARAVLKIAGGQQLDDLTDSELRAVGYKSEGDSFKPMTAAEMKDAGITAPLIRSGADGSIILTDGALKKVGEISTRARGRVKMSESEAIQKAKERAATLATPEASGRAMEAPAGSSSPASQSFDVPMRDGTMLRVSASDGAKALEEAAAQAPISGQPATPVSNVTNPQGQPDAQSQVSPPVQLPEVPVGTPGAANPGANSGKPAGSGQAKTKAEAPVTELVSPTSINIGDKVKMGGGIRTVTNVEKSGDTAKVTFDDGAAVTGGKFLQVERVLLPQTADKATTPAKAEPGKQALALARKQIERVKKNKRLAAALIEGPERAIARPDGIVINPEKIIQEAIKSGMNEVSAGKYFNRVLDEEIRHLAQFDAAKLLFQASGQKGDFKKWMDSHYAGIWQAEFADAGKADIARTLYAGDDAAQLAAWDALSDGDKALEAIRMMSQGDKVTEAAKLWANIGDSLRTALKAALAALRKFSDIASPTLQQEITNLENALKSLTGKPRGGNSKTGVEKPTSSDPGDGTRGPTEGERAGSTPDDGGTEQAPSDGASSPLVVGSKVEFERGGKRVTGVVALLMNGHARVRPDSNPAISFAVKEDALTVIAAPADLKGEKINKEWVAYSEESHSLGIPRAEMPQIHSTDRSAMVQFLKARGIDYVEEEVLPDSLKPTQLEYSPAKVEKAREHVGGNRALLISDDGHLVDGHHQWMAALDEPNTPIRVIRLMARIREILSTVAEMPSVETAGGSTAPTTDEAIAKMAENTQANLAAFEAETKRLQAEQSAAYADATPRAVRLHREMAPGFKWMGATGMNWASQVDEMLSTKESGERFPTMKFLSNWNNGLNLPLVKAFFKEAGIPSVKGWSQKGIKESLENWARPDTNEQPLPQDTAKPENPLQQSLSEADKALLEAMDGLFAAALPESFSKPVPPDRIGPLVTVATKYLAEGVNTPEALAERLGALAEGKMRQFSQSIWFAFKMAGTPGVAEPDWASIYASSDQDATDERQPVRTDEGAVDAPMGEPAVTGKQGPPSLGATGKAIWQGWKALQGVNVAPGNAVEARDVNNGGIYGWTGGDELVRLEKTKSGRNWIATMRPATKAEIEGLHESIDRGALQVEVRRITGAGGEWGSEDAGALVKVVHQATGQPIAEFLETSEGKAWQKRMDAAVAKATGQTQESPSVAKPDSSVAKPLASTPASVASQQNGQAKGGDRSYRYIEKRTSKPPKIDEAEWKNRIGTTVTLTGGESGTVTSYNIETNQIAVFVKGADGFESVVFVGSDDVVESPVEAAAEVKGEMVNPANRRPAKEIKAEIIKRVEEEIAKIPEIKSAFSQPKTKGGKRMLNGRIANIDTLFSIVEKGMGWDIHAGLTPNSENFIAHVEGNIAALQKKAPYHMMLHVTGQKPESVEFSIPGDGTFKLIKDRGVLEEFLGRVRSMPITSGTQPPKSKPFRAWYENGNLHISLAGIESAQDPELRKKLVEKFGEKAVVAGEDLALSQAGVTREELNGTAPAQESPAPPAPAKPAPKPKKQKGPSPLDLLENYFRPGKIVKSYGGEDRVISFNRGDGEQWSVTVQAVDDTDNRGPRSHSTMPSNKELIRAWQERDEQQGIGSSNQGQYPTPSPSTGGKTPSAKAESEVQILPDSPANPILSFAKEYLAASTAEKIKIDMPQRMLRLATSQKDAKEAADAVFAEGLKNTDGTLFPGTDHYQVYKEIQSAMRYMERKNIGNDAAPATTTDTPSAPEAITNLETLLAFFQRIRKGDTTAAGIKATWESYKANEPEIRKEVMKMTMKELERFQGMRKPDNKADAVRMAMDAFHGEFRPGAMFSYGGVIGNREKMDQAKHEAQEKAVAEWTDEKIQALAKERQDAADARKKALENPETKDEWEQFVNRKGKTGVDPETVKEFARQSEGNRIYSVEAIDVVKPAGNWVASISENRRNYTPQAGFEEKMRQKMDEIKGESGGLQASPLPEPEEFPVFKKRAAKALEANRPLIKNAEEQMAAFGPGSMGVDPKFANFGGKKQPARDMVDIVRAVDSFQRTVRKDADTYAKAEELLRKDPAGVEELAMGVYGEGRLAIADHEQVAIEMLFRRKAKEGLADDAKRDDAYLLAEANIMNRREIARTLRIGFDKFMSPTERAEQQIADAIYKAHPKAEKDGKKIRSLAERKAYMLDSFKARYERVKQELERIGVRMDQALGENRRFQLENSRLMKEVLKLRNVVEQGIIKMVQKGASLAQIKKRYGALGTNAQEVVTKAREELGAKLREMLASGMSREQIREAMKDGLRASGLSAESAMAPDDLDALVEAMLLEDFGLPKEIHAVSLPRTKPNRTKAEKPVDSNPLTANWANPEFTDGLASYEFDSKDRNAVMGRVQVIRQLAGAVGKIAALEGEPRAKADAALTQINAILAQYGTDAKGIFEASKGIEDYGFDINDTAQVAAVIRAIHQADADLLDKFTEWSYFAKLSGAKTMIVNAGAIIPAAWEMTVGRGVEASMNILVNDPMSAHFGEFRYVGRALIPAVKRALHNAMVTWQSEIAVFDQDVNNMQTDLEALLKGESRGGMGAGAIGGKTGRFARFPTRILAATDVFNNTLIACAEAAAFAYRLGIAKGLKPGSPEFERHVRVEVNMPGSFSYLMASQKSRKLTYTNVMPGETDPYASAIAGEKVVAEARDLTEKLGEGAVWVSRFLADDKQNPMAIRILAGLVRVNYLPFIRTPYQIARFGMEYTPLALPELLLGIARNNTFHKPDGSLGIRMGARGETPEMLVRASRQLQGAFLLMLLWGLAEGDDDDATRPIVLTGTRDYDSNKRGERELKEKIGLGSLRLSLRKKDGSERFGFGFGRIEPAATTVGAAVDTISAIKRGIKTGNDTIGITLEALGTMQNQLSEKTFTQGIGNLMELASAINSGDKDEISMTMRRQLTGFMVSNTIPNLIRQPIRGMDSSYRSTADSFVEELLYQAAPIGQKQAKTDVFGKPIEKPGTPLGRILDITESGSSKSTPLERMLVKWNNSGKWSKHPDPKERKPWYPSVISSAEYKHPTTGHTVKMNQEQLAEFRQASGRILEASLKAQGVNYENPSAFDIEKVQKTISKAREVAKGSLRFKFARETPAK